VSFAAITLYVASQRVFVVVDYFVIDSVRKLLDTFSYLGGREYVLEVLCSFDGHGAVFSTGSVEIGHCLKQIVKYCVVTVFVCCIAH
jgi:hypothetical protein